MCKDVHMRGVQIPIYLINLDRSPVRLRLFTEQAQSLGLAFERIAAVDGDMLSEEECSAHQSEGIAGRVTGAELACCLSHRRAWQAIHDRGEPWGIVFEDDIHISPEFPSVMCDLERAPPDADIIKIEAWPRKTFISRTAIDFNGRRLHRLKGLSLGAAAYAISRPACERLLARDAVFPWALDNYLFDPRSNVFGQLVTYLMSPALCIQNQFVKPEHRRKDMGGSLIEPTRMRSPKQPFPGKIRREMERFAKKTRAFFRYKRRIQWR